MSVDHTLLASAVDALAGMMMEIDGDTFGSMRCEEIESMADVFAVAGRADAAAHVLMLHGEHDDDAGYTHHDIYQASEASDGDRSASGEPYRLATDHARRLLGLWRAAIV